MNVYRIDELLVDTYYAPSSSRRRFNGGIITRADKRDDVWLDWAGDFETYSVRYTDKDNNEQWATVAVRVSDQCQTPMLDLEN